MINHGFLKMKNEELDDVFFSLSAPKRRHILTLLVPQDLTVGSIAKELGISIASASKHIQVLQKCGLITQVRFGKIKVCKANFEKLHEANLWLNSVGLLNLIDITNLEEYLSDQRLL